MRFIQVELTIAGEVVSATLEHPFQEQNRGWVAAGELRPGDCVESAAGVCREVERARVVPGSITVYNFTVESAHTYFVGKGAWWVHNTCPKEFDIIRYGEELPPGSGLEKHHGILDVWARENLPANIYNRRDAPALVLSQARHNATRSALGSWRYATTGSIRGSINWKNMPFEEAYQLSEMMFKAANIPSGVADRYYKSFFEYVFTGAFIP